MSDLPSSLPRGRLIRRWTAVCLLVAVPVAALALTVVNVLQSFDTDAIAEHQEGQVAQLERRANAARGRTGPGADLSAIYLGGATPTLARAELQRFLLDAVERNAGRVIESQDDAEGALDLAADGRVRLWLTFDMKNGALLDLLHAIETGVPLLTVERIEIRRLDAGADGDPEDPVLRIGIGVAGVGRFAPA